MTLIPYCQNQKGVGANKCDLQSVFNNCVFFSLLLKPCRVERGFWLSCFVILNFGRNICSICKVVGFVRFPRESFYTSEQFCKHVTCHICMKIIFILIELARVVVIRVGKISDPIRFEKYRVRIRLDCLYNPIGCFLANPIGS